MQLLSPSFSSTHQPHSPTGSSRTSATRMHSVYSRSTDTLHVFSTMTSRLEVRSEKGSESLIAVWLVGYWECTHALILSSINCYIHSSTSYASVINTFSLSFFLSLLLSLLSSVLFFHLFLFSLFFFSIRFSLSGHCLCRSSGSDRVPTLMQQRNGRIR